MSTEQTERLQQASPNGDGLRGALVSAAIVVEDGERTSVYSMYEAHELTLEGAFLQGSLLLEMGETVTIELCWGDGGESGRVSARVVGVAHDGVPGMTVAFSHIDECARRLIESGGTLQR